MHVNEAPRSPAAIRAIMLTALDLFRVPNVAASRRWIARDAGDAIVMEFRHGPALDSMEGSRLAV